MRDPALLIIRLARTDGTDWVVKYNEVLGWRVPGVLIITYRKLHLTLIVGRCLSCGAASVTAISPTGATRLYINIYGKYSTFQDKIFQYRMTARLTKPPIPRPTLKVAVTFGDGNQYLKMFQIFISFHLK